MDSVKSIVVVAILLGVLYGIYQVINDDDSPVSPQSTNLLAEFDKETDDTKSKESSDSAEDKESKKESAPRKSPRKKSVKPPPSTFSPKSSRFVFPDRKKSETPKSDPKGTGKKGTDASDSKWTGTNSGDTKGTGKSGFVPKTAPPSSNPTFSDGGFALNNNAKATKPDTGNAFKESASGRNIDSKIDTGVFNPDSSSPLNTGAATQTGAESKINDPRSRFVTGSFVEFEKQVLGDMETAESLIRKEDFVGALKLLTKFYDDPRLTREENQNLASWLDPLAGKVIYSVEPHLVEPYYVRPNDTLKLLSVKFGVPPELIFNINRVAIPDPQKLEKGTELKMIKGPFNAEISLSKKKMTLFVNGLYAGNFKLRIGNEPVPKTGKYRVLSKSRLGQDYTDQNYQRISAASPSNPYGLHYLNLGGGMAIHGSAQVSDSNDRRGCISLNAIDAEDVHNILTTESTVIIVD